MAERNTEKNIALFQEEKPSLESYWRSVVLFGVNTACYKFSLAQSLLELIKDEKSSVTLHELADKYSENICRHIQKYPRQSTSNSSSFLAACQLYIQNQIPKEELIFITEKKGFNWVLDCFHNVNGSTLPVSFFNKSGSKSIVLTDELYKLNESNLSQDLFVESESRWNLVENAWKQKESPEYAYISYDDKSKHLFTAKALERIDITPARGALNGYQKGKCFYCYADINVTNDSTNTCDVDHFIPFSLQIYMPEINLNGVWNLVLTCEECNRGANGKFDKIPALKYLERLHKRNEFLISSHHPLRETIINQTGSSEAERSIFMKHIFGRAREVKPKDWTTIERNEPTF